MIYDYLTIVAVQRYNYRQKPKINNKDATSRLIAALKHEAGRCSVQPTARRTSSKSKSYMMILYTNYMSISRISKRSISHHSYSVNAIIIIVCRLIIILNVVMNHLLPL